MRGAPALTLVILLLLVSPAHAWGPSDPYEDLDGDGLTNLGEFAVGSNPLDPDTDDGGCPDGWEVEHGLDPTKAKDDLWDNDNDGWSNYREYLEGTDPRDPNTDGDLYPLDSTDPYPLTPHGTSPPPDDPDPDAWMEKGGGETMGQGQDSGHRNVPGTNPRPYQGSDMNDVYNEGTLGPWWYGRTPPKDSDYDGLVEFIASL